MKHGYPPVWLSAALLALALMWRMVGAPLTAQQLEDMQTPLWQARVLLPTRVARVFSLWIPGAEETPAQTIREEAMGVEGQALDRLINGEDRQMISVYLADEGRMAEMELESYVCGVVAAEMPAAYHMEALKAQAVAARTRVLWQIQNGGCALHTGADICTDSAHCQGYATPAQCRQQWGGEYTAYRDRVLEAVAATRDELVTYGGQPITVMYHAISGGRTEAAQTVFSQALPYLVSVESAGEEGAAGYQQDTTFTFEEMASLLGEALDLDLTAQEVERTLAVAGYTDTGRVAAMLVGGKEVEGTVFRQALGLRSTWFTLSMDGSGVTFHQRGYGHGVGMSQAGANSMAADGADYRAILTHYYPGVMIEKR
ncbi:MAG: stage II sporulation protein D [Candidatus Limiplasma sp.]|nr:stage II sporulation protein D [Candidatus Limiplasma sp.]